MREIRSLNENNVVLDIDKAIQDERKILFKMKIKVRGNEGLPDGKVVGSYIFTHREKCD